MKNIPEVKLGIVAVSRLTEISTNVLQLWRTRMICSKPLTR